MSINQLVTPFYKDINCNSILLNGSGTSLQVTNNARINGDLTVGGSLTVPNMVYENQQYVTGTNNSTSTSTGSLVVAGGAGIAKDVHIGGNHYVVGNVVCNSITGSLVTSTANSTSTSTGSFIVSGGIGVASDISCTNLNATNSISCNTSTITTANITTLNVLSTQNSLNYANGAAVIAGGLGIAKDVQTNGDIYCNNIYGIPHVTSTVDSTSTSTGAVTVPGGIGIGKNCYVGGNTNVLGQVNALTVNVQATTQSVSTSTGSLVVAGGLGLKGNIYMKSNRTNGMILSALTTTSAGDTADMCIGVTEADYNSGVLRFRYLSDISNTNYLELGVYGPINSSALRLYGNGQCQYTNNAESTSTSTGSMIVNGGFGIAKSLYVGATNASTSTSTGALIVSGGIGAGNKITATRLGIQSASTNYALLEMNNSTSLTNYWVLVGGSDPTIPNLSSSTFGIYDSASNKVGFSYDAPNTQCKIHATRGSTSSSTGALVVSGGVGISKSLCVGGSVVSTKNVITNSSYTANAVGTSNVEKVFFTTTSTSPFTFYTITGTNSSTAYSYFMIFAATDVNNIGMAQWQLSGVMINSTIANDKSLKVYTGNQTNLNALMPWLNITVTNGTATFTITPPVSTQMIWSATVSVYNYIN